MQEAFVNTNKNNYLLSQQYRKVFDRSATNVCRRQVLQKRCFIQRFLNRSIHNKVVSARQIQVDLWCSQNAKKNRFQKKSAKTQKWEYSETYHEQENLSVTIYFWTKYNQKHIKYWWISFLSQKNEIQRKNYWHYLDSRQRSLATIKLEPLLLNFKEYILALDCSINQTFSKAFANNCFTKLCFIFCSYCFIQQFL